MATLSVSLTTSDQTKNINYPSGSIAVTTGDGEQSGSVTGPAGPAEGTIAIGDDITTVAGNGPGLLLLRNLSTTAAELINVGTATGVYNWTVNANDGVELNWAVIALKSTVTEIRFLAASGTPQLWYKIFERGA